MIKRLFLVFICDMHVCQLPKSDGNYSNMATNWFHQTQ